MDYPAVTFSLPGGDQPVAIFKGKTEEEKAAAVLAQEAARADQAARDAVLHEEKRQATFAASPAGQAQAARRAGRRYFQIVRDVSTSSGSATYMGNLMSRGDTDQTGLIESIEDQGWALQNVGYVFQETASDSKSKAIGSGERTAISGKIVGIYLFRATPASAS